MMSKSYGSQKRNYKILIFCLILATFLIYYFSNPNPQNHFDYTFRVAENFLHGKIAFTEKPPSWLNEFVSFNFYYYSVFPLGSVLTMLPFAVFKFVGIIETMPGGFIAALTAALICWFLFLISNHYEYKLKKRILLAAGILFGTWMWTNLMMAGAWHLALGFAVLGEFGAIYFTVFNRKPFIAGLFFAFAFGNRTEILLTAPIFLFLLYKFKVQDSKFKDQKHFFSKENILTLAKFCIVPFVLGVATLIYNYVRFHSFTDFGYARIPGVLDEPWYRYGIFSIYYIPLNFLEMLYTPWKLVDGFPYALPSGFGGSIWWSSPFILLAARFGARRKLLKYTAWAAIIILTFLLWIHGNPGGFQFGYRYAMILLPWLYLILLENSPEEITFLEWIAYIFSFIINAYATYLFFWTTYVSS